MLMRESIVAGLLGVSYLIIPSLALDAPCYGYGNIMGKPSNFLEDDLEQVKALKVGQGSTYVGYLNYLFEGKNHMQLGYKKTDDEDFRAVSQPHGAKTNVGNKRYTFLNSKSRMLSPGMVMNETKQAMISLMFVEYFNDGELS